MADKKPKPKTAWQATQEEIKAQESPIYQVKSYLKEKLGKGKKFAEKKARDIAYNHKQLKAIAESDYEFGKDEDNWDKFKRLMAIKKAGSTHGQMKSGTADKDIRSSGISRTKNQTYKDFARGFAKGTGTKTGEED